MNKRKIKFVFITLLFLSSCSVFDSNRVAVGYMEAFRAIDLLIFGYDDYEISRDLVNNIPYASSLIKIGKGPKGLIILESIEENKETWVSADGLYLIIENGRIVETRGFANNLIEYISQSELALTNESSQDTFSYYSYDKPRLNNLRVGSKITHRKNQEIKILEQTKRLTLIEEELNNDYLGWKVTNRFWLDEENFVWKSEQYLSPKLPKIIIEVTKKPS